MPQETLATTEYFTFYNINNKQLSQYSHCCVQYSEESFREAKKLNKQAVQCSIIATQLQPGK